ncbi:MAG: DNA polymerase I [Bacilli bacterium]|nr:DNA polymerase I [Bacilli bacterium]
MKKIIIIDGCAILYRIYYATAINQKNNSIMCTQNGNPTNAIFGFINVILKLIADLNEEDLIFVGFDSGDSFRKREFDRYKINRKPTPQELKEQIPAIYEFLDVANIKYFQKTGFEGDDICGSAAVLASKNNYDVFIYTSDKDFLQLINDNISIKMMRKGLSEVKTVTAKNIKEIYGFRPNQLTDFKGLVGDDSDNLPGIPKIGPKRAIELLEKYNNLENVIKHVDELKGQIKENIINFAEQGKKTKQLATIEKNIILPFKINDLNFKEFNIKKIETFCEKYELKSIFRKILALNKIKKNNKIENDYLIVNDLPKSEYNSIDFWLLTNNDDDYHKKNTIIKMIFVKTNENSFIIYGQQLNNAKNLKKVLDDKNIKKYTYNLKKIKIVLNNINFNVNGVVFDLMIAAYLLNHNIEDDLNQIKKTSDDDKIVAKEYIAVLTRLKDIFLKELTKHKMLDLFNNIEMPLSDVLTSMEIEGVPVNKNELNNIKLFFAKKNNSIENEIFDIAGKKFNILSPKQVIDVLNEKIILKNKITSTNADNLLNLKDTNPLIDKILKYRSYAKLIAYIENLISNIQENKIHTIFNQTKTSTGRLSSSKPNLQNIAINNEEEKEIRKSFFYQDNDCFFLSFDYSQIELKILSILSNEKDLIDIFKQNKDIHCETAKKIFNIVNREPTPSERKIAKEINYSIIYGIQPFNLSKKINKSISESKEIINNFFKKNENIKSFLEQIIANMSKNQYVETFFHRKRFFENDEINNKNFHIREFAKRAAINAPIQGTAADIIKISMIKINNILNKKNYKSKLILQIHDELVFKVFSEEKKNLVEDVTNIMENFDCFPIKLKVDVHYGKSLYDV